jgi:hypothetical protein
VFGTDAGFEEMKRLQGGTIQGKGKICDGLETEDLNKYI